MTLLSYIKSDWLSVAFARKLILYRQKRKISKGKKRQKVEKFLYNL
jgi:hypothetical protein